MVLAACMASMLGVGVIFGVSPAEAQKKKVANTGPRAPKPGALVPPKIIGEGPKPLPSGPLPPIAAIPQSRHPMVGYSTFLPKDVTLRSTVGLKGFDQSPALSRALIGGSNGANVPEQVVNITQTPAIDERVPVWSSDERFLYFAGSPQNNGANPRYGLYRVSAAPPPGVTIPVPTPITDPADTVNGYYFPALNAAATRIAFLRSSDAKGVDDPTKRYELYVSNVPTAAGQFIDVNPTGPSNLVALTVGKDFPNGAGGRVAFTNIGRPTWIGSNDLAFAAQLTGDANYHIFTINIQTRVIFQLTGNAGGVGSDERNPTASPDGRYIAFDSDARPNVTGGTYNNVLTTANNGTPATATRVRSESDPASPLVTAPKGTGNIRNIFVMGNLGQNATQITGQYANAPQGITSQQPAWTSQQNNNFTNPAGQTLYLGFSSDRVPTYLPADTQQSFPQTFVVGPPGTSSIYYVVFSRTGGNGTVSPPRLGNGFFGENVPTDLDNVTADGARLIDTANETPTASGGRNLTQPRFADLFPTFAPFIGVFRSGFQSNREGTLNRNGFGNGFTVTPLNRNNLFIASLIDINAPSLIRYDTSNPTGEVLHISLVTNNAVPFDRNSAAVRSRETGITPGSTLHFALRVEDRESGMRPENSGDGGAVYLMFKNPNSKYQSQTQGGNGVEHKEFGAPIGRGAFLYTENNSALSYTNTNTGVNFGAEYEADAISALDRTTYYQHRANSLGNGPIYLPGLDDSAAFSGTSLIPLDGNTYPQLRRANGVTSTVPTPTPAIWLRLTPLVEKNPDGTNQLDANGNTIPIRPNDGLGGVLYGATWQIPSEASDWYVDAILYDNAINPFDRNLRSNVIMYDNIWGFSSALPISGPPTDILVVADYTLGQKFFASRFGVNPTDVNSGNNLQPLFWGAESYYTDIDMARYPSEQGGSEAPPSPGSTTTRRYDRFGPFNVSIVIGPGGAGGGVSNSGTPNVLGVESYIDEYLTDGSTPVDGIYSLPPTGRYNIWRVLSRGPVPSSLLTDYLPQRTTAPADIRVSGETTPRIVTSAKRMVVWASPFSGDLFVGAGTITDIQTQNNLTNFVQSGGRLFISGQDIAFALAGNSQSNAFFTNILKARFVNDNGGGGATGLVVPGDPATTPGQYVGQIHHDAWDSATASHAYGLITGGTPFFVYTPPDVSATNNPNLRINNYVPGVAVGDAAQTSASLAGFLDSVDALPTAQNPAPPLNLFPPDAVNQFSYNSTGQPTIIASSFPAGTSAVGIPQNYDPAVAAIPQGKVAYCAMGYESVSLGYYTYTLGQLTYLANLGRRAEVMHNITCSFRNGDILGRIVDNNGSPVNNALVRAVYNNIGNEPNPAAGTALTDENGNFRIVGLQAGFYYIYGYKAGFYTQHNTGNTVHGGWRSATNLALKAASPGALGGIPNGTARNGGGVFGSDGVTPVPGIEVQVRRIEADGSYTAVTTISSNGVSSALPAGAYSLPNLLIANYQVLANARTKVVNGRIVPKERGADGNFLPSENVNEAFGEVRVTVAPSPTFRLGAGTTVVNDPAIGDAVPILEGVTALVDFLLPSAPQAVQGQVVQLGTNTPIPNANISATLLGTTTVVATAITDANGNYTLSLVTPVTGQDPTLLPGGTYVIHADANGFDPNVPPSVNDVQVAVGGGSTAPFAQAPLIQLAALPPGSVSGLVQINNGTVLTSSGVSGATVSFFVVSTVNGVDQQQTTPAFTATVTEPPTVTADNPPYRFNYQATGVKPGRYNAYVSKSGLAGSPNPFANVVITAGVETRNINFTLEPPKIYGAGIQLLSVPFDYSALDPRTVFGLTPQGDNNGNGTPNEAADQTIYNTFNVADWTGTDYNISPTIPLRLGKGYFVRFGSISVVTAPSGGSPQGSFTINLTNSWNLIGHPFDNRANPGSPAPDINITDPTVVTFSYTTASGAKTNVGLSQAVADGVVGSVAYSYTGSNAGSTYVQTGLIRPFFGYWFRAFAAVQMTVQYPDPAFRSVGATRATVKLPAYLKASPRNGGKFVTQSRAEADKPVFRPITSKGLTDWHLQLSAQQGDLKDSDNSIGVTPDAKNGFDNRYDNEKPPMVDAADSLYLGIKGSDATGRATNFSDLVQNAASGGAVKSWEFVVQASDPAKGDVTLTWPNAARLPRGVEPVLIDTVSGKRFNMRTGGSSFRFTPSAGRAEHRFRVEVAPPATTPLALMNVRVNRTPGAAGGRATGSGFRFAFTVTRDADVTAQVQTLSGQVIRTINSRAVRGTEASVAWDGRSAIGADVPAGTYILAITARDTTRAAGNSGDGGQVTRLIPFVSLR